MSIHRVGSLQQLPVRAPVPAGVAVPAQPAAAPWGRDDASFGGALPYATPPFMPQLPSTLWGQMPPYPGAAQPPTTLWGQTPPYPGAAQPPTTLWGQTPPFAPGPTPAQLAELQALMAEVTRLQQQLDAILAVGMRPAPSWGAVPAGPTMPAPGWPPASVVPMNVPPPVPLPPVPMAPPPVVPPLPAPPPVITAVPLPPLPGSVTPAPGATAPGTAQPALLQLSGLPAGTRLRLAPGTSVKGFDVSGTAAVRESSPQVLDLIAKGSALFGFVRRTYGLRAEAQPDGTMKIALNEIGRNGKPKKSVFSGKLKVLDSRPGSLKLEDPNGKAGSITQGPDGSLTVQHPEGTIRFLVAGRAPLIAGIDDVDNDRALA
jgi:hypothetical protein